MASKRLIKELDAYNREPSNTVASLQPVADNDLFNLRAVLRGPDDTAYEGGVFELSIAVPQNYPSAPPSIHFITTCCHVNVHLKTGEICLDLLKSAWTPAYGLVSTLEAIQQLLSAGGDAESPLNLDLARLVRDGDLVGAEGLVRFYTGMYAVPRS